MNFNALPKHESPEVSAKKKIRTLIREAFDNTTSRICSHCNGKGLAGYMDMYGGVNVDVCHMCDGKGEV